MDKYGGEKSVKDRFVATVCFCIYSLQWGLFNRIQAPQTCAWMLNKTDTSDLGPLVGFLIQKILDREVVSYNTTSPKVHCPSFYYTFIPLTKKIGISVGSHVGKDY